MMPSADPMPDPSQSAPGVPRRSRLLPAALAALGILLLFSVFFFSQPAPARRSVHWLTPAQLTQALRPRPRPLRRFKGRLTALAPPWFLRWYWRHRPCFHVDLKVLALSSLAACQTALGPPTETNAHGVRAWILSPAQSRVWEKGLKGHSLPPDLARAGMMIGAGLTEEAVAGRTVPAAGGLAFAGWKVIVAPRFAAGAVELRLGATLTEQVPALPARPSVIHTNFAVACQTSMPNGGTVVIDAQDASRPDGTNYWLILSLTFP